MPKVLIVDDEPMNRELGEALVSAEGYQSLLAENGEEAIQILKEQRPDIVLLDIIMPKLNGIETCRRIKTNPLSYATPVIMVTALDSTEERIKAIKAGADDFITKPFDRTELSVRLKSLLRLKSIHDRLESSLVTLREMQREREVLMERAVKDIQAPLGVIADFMQSVGTERHQLSNETAQKVEPALFCTEMASTMATDFINIMQMEHDKLKQAYDAIVEEQKKQEQR